MEMEKAKKRGRPAQLLQIAELHAFVEFLLSQDDRSELQNQVIDALQANDCNFEMLSEAEQILVKEALKPYREHLKLQLLFDELSKNSKRTEYEGKFIQLYESYQKNELDPAELNILKVMCTRYHKFKAQQLELKDLELYLSQIQKKDAGKKRKAENQRKFEVGGGVLSLYKIKNDDSLDPKNFLNRMKSDRYFAGYFRKSKLYKQVWALDLLPAEKAALLFEVLHQILSLKNNDTGTNSIDLALSKAQRQLKIKKEQSQ